MGCTPGWDPGCQPVGNSNADAIIAAAFGGMPDYGASEISQVLPAGSPQTLTAWLNSNAGKVAIGVGILFVGVFLFGGRR